ncbi:sensor histidine kinase [Streptomyces sp. NPDC056690]|uniref:sensor histidine kinase n=1 Tax=unclassified Streptomyces TaxID=2593676 RepID=UPI0036296287
MEGDRRRLTGPVGADRKALIGDVTLAVVIGALVVAAAVADGGVMPPDAVLIAAGALTLAAYRRAPRTVLALTTACTAGYVLHAEPGALAALPVLAAVHTASRAGHRLLAALAGAAFLVVCGVAGRPLESCLLLAGWFLCAVVTGLADKNWQAYLRQTEQRALEAERTREEAALRRAGEERLRIARELHDSLTHSISIVKLQAGVAVHLARKRGEEVPPALLAIQEASGEAMRELRSTLDVLRADEPTGSPALLVERARSAGLDVELVVTGRERLLPTGLDRAAYRIVQESLTNVARHAGPTGATVRLAYEEHELLICVEDGGAADPARPPVPGNGLKGMAERVAALGGTLHAAPRPEGGFAVRARLPVEGAARLPGRERDMAERAAR